MSRQMETVDKKAGQFIMRLTILLLIYFGIAGILFWIVRESWSKEAVTTDPVNRVAMTESIGGEIEASQTVRIAMERLERISLDLYVQDPAQDGVMTLSVLDENGTVIALSSRPYRELVQEGQNEFNLTEPLEQRKNQEVTVRIHTDGGIRLGYGNTVTAGKMEVRVQGAEYAWVGSEQLPGTLVIIQQGNNPLKGEALYWPCAFILFGVLVAFLLWSERRNRKGEKDPLTAVREIIHRYRYLVKQLVFRDFKVKYKASLLGVLWSLLNPLLMTMVYYLVFSKLFSTQKNFIVYLMTGTVLFNYFSESTSQGLYSIVNNASLITKVYMPKYIFPVSKVLSAAINLLVSMVPMLVLMVLNGLAFTKALLLIPVVVCFMIAFCSGLSLMLSCCMVFFRDTQFLWNVIVLMWNFLSPIFYPESIIPASLIGIYRLNPMYQFMTFLRSITIQGTAPGPACWGGCIAASLLSLVIGIIVFRSTQNKITIHL